MIKVFDFFSGCGGSSSGFSQAGLEITLGLDFDPDAALTFKENFPDADFILSDIRSVDVSALSPWIDGNSPVLFCGCAPCQPFSRQNSNKFIDDPRRNLLSEFERFIREWLPDYIFIENVPGLQRLDSDSGPLKAFKIALTELNYNYDIKVLPALWFGVPQTRERLVLLAAKDAHIFLPSPTHGLGRMPVSTVYDWIRDLPKISAGQKCETDPEHQAAKLSLVNLARIRATPEGGGRESWPDDLWLDCHKNHKGHTDVYGRLAWSRPAAGLTTRCISYSNGRFGHPDQDRALSIREAACLQTFPMTYRFHGTLSSKARQIGNAVPPVMAKAIGVAIRDHYVSKVKVS